MTTNVKPVPGLPLTFESWPLGKFTYGEAGEAAGEQCWLGVDDCHEEDEYAM